MPHKAKIADIERSIEDLLGTIAAMRGKGANQATIDPLLARLARLKAERLKLLERQRLVSPD